MGGVYDPVLKLFRFSKTTHIILLRLCGQSKARNFGSPSELAATPKSFILKAVALRKANF